MSEEIHKRISKVRQDLEAKIEGVRVTADTDHKESLERLAAHERECASRWGSATTKLNVIQWVGGIIGTALILFEIQRVLTSIQ